MLEMRLSDMSEKKNERRRAGGGGGRKKVERIADNHYETI